MSIGTSTSTGRRLIAPVTAAATGPDTAAIAQVAGAIGPVAADIALAAAAIAAAGTAAATEVAAGIGAAAAVAIADRPDRDRSQRTAFLIVARQAAAL
jgi:hypothetical protein